MTKTDGFLCPLAGSGAGSATIDGDLTITADVEGTPTSLEVQG